MKGVLVLGSNGSLGSNICKELRENKFRILFTIKIK